MIKKIEKVETIHKPVLLDEVIDNLVLKDGDIVFDGTLGGGGYSEKILEKIGENGILIGTDLDSKAIERTKKRLENFQTEQYFFQKNYSEIKKILEELKIDGLDKAVLDLGISSDQLEQTHRGISFKNLDDDLDMNLTDNNERKKITAREILNNWSEESIADIIYYYGGEKAARKIAQAIVQKREEKRFQKVGDLVELINTEIGVFYRHKKIHPATKTFQALRITVNDEIENLKLSIKNIFESLKPGGIFAIVTFHSLEDKVVKKSFRDIENEGFGKRINKKVIKPSLVEEKENPRARSAKLRLIQKK